MPNRDVRDMKFWQIWREKMTNGVIIINNINLFFNMHIYKKSQ